MPELGAMGKTSAPGQLSIDDLRMRKITWK